MDDGELVFRIYKPMDEQLEEKYKPIEVEPTEALTFIDSIIENAKKNAPDGPNGLAALTPRASCGDIKRIMKEEVDELLDETIKALSELKMTDHDID